MSVVIPVYRAEKLLPKCIKSLQAQTLTDLEIILVEDGSPDQSGSLCDSFAREDTRIKVLHQENAGVSAARNRGMELATGEYIGFVDSDDYVEPSMYEEMLAVAEETGSDIVMCDCYKEFGEERTLYTHSKIGGGYYDSLRLKSEYYGHLLMENSVDYPPTISCWTLLLRRDLIEMNRLRFPEGIRFSEDLLFGSQAVYYADSFFYMKDRPLYHYVMNAESSTHVKFVDKWSQFLALYHQISRFFSNVPDYDFSHQIDLSLLYFVYHALGNLKRCELSSEAYRKETNAILKNREVRDMLRRIRIRSLDISKKHMLCTQLLRMGVCI